MSLPSKCEYLIIGGGIHGLSTAWHLCKKLSSKGQLKEDSVVVIEKTKVGEGATSVCLLYTSPSPRDRTRSRMPSSA